jgi:hypothetical protein
MHTPHSGDRVVGAAEREVINNEVSLSYYYPLVTTMEDYLNLAAGRLTADGATVSSGQIGGLNALVGYRSQFRLAWMATRLHLLTVIAAKPHVSAADVPAFVDAALDHAKAEKGRWRGLQSGVAVIAALIGQQVDPSAAAFARDQLVRKFAVIGWPAVVDLSTGQVHSHQGRVAIGGIYAGYLRQQTAVALPEPALLTGG